MQSRKGTYDTDERTDRRMNANDKRFVIVLRQLDIWEALYSLPEPVTLKDLAWLLDKPTSTIYRDLILLVAEGSVVRTYESFWNGMYYAKRCYYTVPGEL